MSTLETGANQLDRRSFVRNGSLYLLGAGLSLSHVSGLSAEESKRKVRFGLSSTDWPRWRGPNRTDSHLYLIGGKH